MSIVLLDINYLGFVLLKTTDFFFNKTTVLFLFFQGVNFSRNQGVSLKWRAGGNLCGFSIGENKIIDSLSFYFPLRVF
jgi:hypothetical protein